MNDVSRILSDQRHFNIPIFIPHLGCPYDCIYCDQKIIANQTAAPSTDQVINTIEQHLSTIPAGAWTEVAFFGGSFTAISPSQQEYYLRTVQPYIKQGRIKGIRISTRPNCINADNLDLLASYGVSMVELGVQSMRDEVLKASGRGYDSRAVQEAGNQIKRKNLQLGIQLMVGLPGDNPPKAIASAREAASLQPQAVRIYPTLVLTGTKLAVMYGENRYTPLGLEEAVSTTKEMYLIFCRHEIPVIRMGLYPGEELRKPGIVQAGPFHSSFGELVEQEVFREQAHRAIQSFWAGNGDCSDLCLYVNPRDLSKLIGHRRSNIIRLSQVLGLDRIEVKGCHDQVRDSVGVGKRDESVCYMLSRRQYIEDFS